MNWSEKLAKAKKHEVDYHARAKSCVTTYRDEHPGGQKSSSPKMNLLWSNTETLRPALYSQTPNPVVNRRFNQDNPQAREASDVLERAISFSVDNGLGDFDLFAQKVITDYLLVGRSVDRACYVPLTGNEKDEEGYAKVVFEEVQYKHVPWDQFRYDPVDRWCDVTWIAYGDHWYDWEDLKEAFDLTEADKYKYVATKNRAKDTEEYQVWEIWDRESEKVIWQIEGCEDPIKEEPPPVRLRGFFDCPEPLYSFKTNDSLIPIPEYTLYQYQAEEVNILTARIGKISNLIRANFAYAGDQKNLLSDLLTADDGVGIPVANWTTVMEKGGIDGMLAFSPIEQYVKTLQILIAQRSQLIQQIFEITGVSDIQRGATDARETARAQSLKANFGNRRLLPRQRDVQRYFRDLFRLAGEIAVENFSRETLQDIVGKPIPDPVLMMLRDDSDRAFQVDIETDSTIAPDEMQQKQDLAEFMGAISQFLPAAQMIAQQGGQQAMTAILLWAIRRFRAGRDVEGILETMMRQPPPPPKPSPEEVKAQGELKKIEANTQAKQAESQMRMQELAAKLEAQKKESQLELEAKVQEMRLEQAAFIEQMKRDQQESQVKIMNIVAQGAAKAQAARMQPRKSNGA